MGNNASGDDGAAPTMTNVRTSLKIPFWACTACAVSSRHHIKALGRCRALLQLEHITKLYDNNLSLALSLPGLQGAGLGQVGLTLYAKFAHKNTI